MSQRAKGIGATCRYGRLPVASAFQPTPRARFRRALGLVAALAALGLGAAPAVSASLDGLFTGPAEPDQPAPAPTPPVAELRPFEPPGLDPLLSEPSPDPAALLAPSPGLGELIPLLAPPPAAKDDAGANSLSHVSSASPSTASGEDSKTLAADTPQGTGSPSPEPTTGAAAPEAGAGDQGPGAVPPAAPAPSGAVTAAALAPVIDAVSRPIGSARRSRETAPTSTGDRSAAPVRVAALGLVRQAAPTGSPPPAATAPPAPAPAAPLRVRHRPVPAPAAGAQAVRGAVRVVTGAGRSPWLPIALLLATVAYVLGQRLMDGGRKLSHAGQGDEPDDELIEL
jgi:hypothetical protein